MEIWKPPPPRVPTLARIGRAFRSAFTFEGPRELARRAFTCPLCNGPTSPSSRHWSAHYRRYVDLECIPSIVRRAGKAAVVEWLDTGELTRGTLSHRELVSWQTQSVK
jgi:hypothetical protein